MRPKPEFSDYQLAARAPVWNALSELFLDTELNDDDLTRIADQLRRSAFTTRELERILYDEVYPACIANLQCVAGEWAGFDAQWLQERICARRRRWFSAGFGLRLCRRMVDNEWQAIKRSLNGSGFNRQENQGS